MEEPERETFEKLLLGVCNDLKKHNKTKEFTSYFERVYRCRKNQWALCYRSGSGVNTNMHVEAFHRVLNCVYLHGRVNRRLDTLVFILLKFARDKGFNRLIKLSKGKAGINRMRMIRDRHQTSSTMSPACIEQIREGHWQIKSDKAKDSYIYTVQRESITLSCCSIMCNQCQICIHQFSCTCMDFLVRTTICKHIHLVVTTATTQSVHMSQQEAVNWNPHPTDPLPIQTDDPPQLDVNWESVVDSLAKIPKQTPPERNAKII